MADLASMTDEELEQEGFRLEEERAAAIAEWRDKLMEQQAEVTKRSDARGGAAPAADETVEEE